MTTQAKKTVLERARERFASRVFTRIELTDMLGYDGMVYLKPWSTKGEVLVVEGGFVFVEQGKIQFPPAVETPAFHLAESPDYDDVSPPPVTDKEVDDCLKALGFDDVDLASEVKVLIDATKKWRARAIIAERELQLEKQRLELLKRNTRTAVLQLRKEVESLA